MAKKYVADMTLDELQAHLAALELKLSGRIRATTRAQVSAEVDVVRERLAQLGEALTGQGGAQVDSGTPLPMLKTCDHATVMRSGDSMFPYTCVVCFTQLTTGALPHDVQIWEDETRQEPQDVQVEPEAQVEPEGQEPNVALILTDDTTGLDDTPIPAEGHATPGPAEQTVGVEVSMGWPAKVEPERQAEEETLPVMSVQAVHVPQSEFSISWTTCFVCQTARAAVEWNGRCQECYEFFRQTGADRDMAEVTPTPVTPVIEAEPLAKEALDLIEQAAVQASAVEQHAASEKQRRQSGELASYAAAMSLEAQTLLCDLVAQGEAAVIAALGSKRGHRPKQPRGQDGDQGKKGAGFGQKVLAQIPAEVQAAMRADRATGMSYVKIDLKHGYPAQTNGRMAYTVCKMTTQDEEAVGDAGA